MVPVYCAEISPRNLRGALTTAHQLFFSLGILVAALLSMNVVLGSEARWPLLLGVSASLATAHFFLFLFCPESPRSVKPSPCRDAIVGAANTNLPAGTCTAVGWR